jgi:uncharacterized protein (DUF1501 family)
MDALTTNNPSYTGGFRLHPQAGPLKELYDARKLAIVHACGLNDDTRSHFDAMDYMERGTPGNKNMPTGWLTRHIACVNPTGVIPTLATAQAAPASLLGDPDTLASTAATHLSYPAAPNSAYNIHMVASLRKLYSGDTPTQRAGKRLIRAIDDIAGKPRNYTPVSGISYPANGVGNSLMLVAQMIKLDLGIRIATVDFGGWDTHEGQGNGGDANTYFGYQTDTLARGLHALYNDLPQHQSKLTVVVMSEFGRRLGANNSGGTDHGHGNTMLVLGGQVNGGKLYGTWPGLEDLDQQQDLRITTDYRTVLSEILVRRLDNPQLGQVFPGFCGYSPLGITGSPADDLPIECDRKTYVPMIRG